MSDSRSAYDEQLPWLEAVDDEDGPSGIPARRMLAALLVVLLASAVVAGTFFWLGRQNVSETAGAPELIKADPKPYKIKPTDPGGLDVAGESETAFQTSAGEDTDAQLDLSRMPEQAVAPPSKPVAEPKPAEAPKPQPKETAPKQPAGGKGSVIQLGAFANRAQAERAWSALSARFPSVAAMNKMVIPFSGGIRLRASASSPAEARQACQALKVAGENCFVAN
jgi:sporulation related protein